MADELLQTLARAVAQQMNGGMSTKDALNYNTATLLTQPGGIFSTHGIERNIVSTFIAPMGLGSYIPAFPSNVDDPRVGFLLGVTDTTGDEPTYPCDNAPAGYLKAGTLTYRFGRVQRDTNTIEVDKILHEKRGATRDLMLMGNMMGSDLAGMAGRNPLEGVVMSEMAQVGVQLERKLSRLVWQGTPGNNTAGGGYAEFPGLDLQIATGHMDADTGTLMPAADSLVFNFNYNIVDGSTLNIVEYMSYMEHYLSDVAMRTGVQPVQWAVVMRPDLWFELSSVWACRYMTNRCSAVDTSYIDAVPSYDAADGVRLRDDMRNGMYIIINGKRLPVITDDGILEHTNANNGNLAAGDYASSIYFVPLRMRGNFPTTYWEYINYSVLGNALSPLPSSVTSRFWTEGGKLLWTYEDQSYCIKMHAKIEPRLVLRTPHLAGRIDYVRYSPMQHLREPYPDSPYFKDGGLSVRGGSTNYAVWGNFTV